MKNKIALTAILAALATNAAFAYTFNGGVETADCTTPDNINVTVNTAQTPVQYNADWGNKTYTIHFDRNNSAATATGSKADASCKYFDENDSPSSADKCTDLNSVDTFANAGQIVTSWNTVATPTQVAPGTSIPLNAEYLQNLDANALGNEANTTMTLYAQWTDCAVKYSDDDAVNANNNSAKHVESVVAQATNNNTCSYLVTCADGFNIGDSNAATTKIFTDPTSVTIDSDVCSHRNKIYLQWNANDGTIGGQASTTGTCDYGTPAGLTPSAVNGDIDVPRPTRPGYEFKGWDIVD